MKTRHLITILLLIITSCNKEKAEGLPKKTAQGANTFGCIIDNNPFIARDRCDYSVGLNLQSNCVEGEFDYYDRNTFRIFSRNDYFINNQEAKVYILVQMDSSQTKLVKLLSARFIIEDLQGDNSYSLDTLQNNEFKINNALNRAVYYGTFTLHLKNNTGQMKVLRDGRFDVAK
jgi:hypothetical protein